MITDLNPGIDKTNVDSYMNGLIVEFDKLHVSLIRDTALGSQEKAKIVRELRDYIRLTQVYPDRLPIDEIPPKEIPG